MAYGQTALMKVEALIQQARFHPAGALPTETHQSYPVPVRGKEGLRVLFMYCPSHASMEEGLVLLAPYYVAYLNAVTGVFEEMRRVTPKELGRPDQPDQRIGAYVMPPGISREEFVVLQAQLYEGYDALMPLFLAGQTRASPETKRLASEFRRLFLLITEAPLEPYYSVVGQDFFHWLDQIIQG